MTDEELVAQFIATRGVTRCPAAFAANTHVEISEKDRAAHVAHDLLHLTADNWSVKNGGRGVGAGGITSHWRNKRLASKNVV